MSSRPSAKASSPIVPRGRGDDATLSKGQTEGQITKFKLVKRQMYGRAKLDPAPRSTSGPGVTTSCTESESEPLFHADSHLAAQLKIPVLRQGLGEGEVLLLRTGAALLAFDRGGTPPEAAIAATIELDLATENLVCSGMVAPAAHRGLGDGGGG